MDIDIIDIGFIEMNPQVQEEISEEYLTYVDTWDDNVQEIASRILEEYCASTGKTEEIFEDEDKTYVDSLVFAEIV